MPAPVSKPSRSLGTQADQEEVFSFLGDSRTFGLAEPVERIDTHGAAVFLAGGEVYKVKRAVRFPFMDFSTLEKRRAACEAEIAINKPNAPDIYLGAIPIARTANGLTLDGEGEIVEWAAHMRRFDENATLDRLAERAALSPVILVKLALAILKSHKRASRRRGGDACAGALSRSERAGVRRHFSASGRQSARKSWRPTWKICVEKSAIAPPRSLADISGTPRTS
jgi:aminoglycoside phosphotransferase family enzyme